MILALFVLLALPPAVTAPAPAAMSCCARENLLDIMLFDVSMIKVCVSVRSI